MKNIIIGILAIIVIGLGVGWKATRDGAMEDLKAANQAVLDEANFSQGLRKTITEQKETQVERDAELAKAWSALDQMQAKLDRSVIIGRVYADANYNRAVDGIDHLVSDSNVKVVLYSVKRGSDGTLDNIKVASTAVVNGEYLFDVEPGEYFVGIEYNDYQTYIRRYNLIIHISGSNMVIEAGETVPGPTILLTN